MQKTRRYFILLLIFSFLFGIATWILNTIEGSKIHTTEFVNFGSSIGFLSGLVALMLIGPLVILPISGLLNKKVHSLILRIATWIISNIILGLLVFTVLFSDFADEYNLSFISAIVIYTVVGVLYSLCEYQITRKSLL